MADKRYEIEIATTASGSGAQETKDELQGVAEEAAKVGQELGEGGAAPVEQVQQMGEALERAAEGAKATKEELKGVAEEAQRTVQIFDSNAPKIGPRLEDGSWFPKKEEVRAAADEMTRMAAVTRTSFEELEKAYGKEQEIVTIAQQRQILAYQLLEATEAKAAGDQEGAAWMMREVQIRRDAIALQQQAKMTEAEALELATQRVAAEEKAAAAEERAAAALKQGGEAGNTLGAVLSRSEPRWKSVVTHATTISGQLAAGGGSLQTWLGLLGAITPAWAGIGALLAAGYNALNGMTEKQKEFALGLQQSGERMEENTRRLKDLQKGSSLDLWKEAENVTRQITDLTKRYREESIKGNTEALAQIEAEIENRGILLGTLERTARARWDNEEATKAAAEAEAAFQKWNSDALKDYEQQLQESAKLAEKLKDLNSAGLSNPEKLRSYQSALADIVKQFRDLGIEAETADQAFRAAEGIAGPIGRELQKAALEWAQLQGKINSTAKTIANDAAARAKEIRQLGDEIDSLVAKIPKLQADLKDMQAEGNDFIEAQWETLGGASKSGWFRRADVVQNASGQWKPPDDSKQVAANDADLLRFQQVQNELTAANQKLQHDQQDLTRLAAEVSNTTRGTADSAAQFGEGLQKGLADIQTAVSRLPGPVQQGSAQTVQAIQVLQGGLEQGFGAVNVAIAQTVAAVNKAATRIQALERTVYR